VVAITILIAFIAAAMVLKRQKLGVYLAIILGVIVIMQPLVYHVIMGKACLSGIWWYPIFTAVQGYSSSIFPPLPY
jgi:uncharacterized membrane protein YeaQ/YmgE (transglycosylase-associated protein family)